MAIDLQAMVQSAAAIIEELNIQAEETVGIECLWCRATPEVNSESIILQEYTLTNLGLECPKQIKVVTTNTDYQPGNFTVDLFGVSYDAPVELQITISNWQSVFGSDTMPQQGDVVYIMIWHKLYEVKTSEVYYNTGSQPMYFKCQLAKYNPSASRKETAEFRTSIEELTDSQSILFGEPISEEVADAVIEVETAYNTTTYVDPIKDFDMSSVIYLPLTGPDGVEISHAYYDMSTASKAVTYNVSATFSTEMLRQHWIYTCWFRCSPEYSSDAEYTARRLTLYLKEKKYWYFKISTPLKLYAGDNITIKRGVSIKASGTVVQLENEEDLLLRFKTADMTSLSKKYTGWYESGSFKISKTNNFNLIKSDNDTFGISMDYSSNSLSLTFGKATKTITFSSGIYPEKWTYLAVDFTTTSINIVLEQLVTDESGKLALDNQTQSVNLAVKPGDFTFETLSIDSAGTGLQIRNIRLYENETALGDTYKLDQMSQVTRNASKLILVDAPNPKNDGMFYSPVR